MRQIKGCLGFLALSAGVAFAMPAAASQWLSTGAAGTAAGMTMTDSVTGQVVKVRAYSTKTASNTSSVASDGLFQNANLMLYGGGFGITNTVGGDSYEGAQPEHAIDNNQVFDVLVFELPSAGFDLEAFRLGWATEVWAPSSTVNNEADIQAYFGGNNLGAGYDFKNACFTNCDNSGSGITAKGTLTSAAMGFTNMNPLITVGLGGGENVPGGTGTNVTIAGTQSGRYLVMTGALGGTNDNFKVEMLKASGGSGVAPEPGTLALMALGLFGLVTLRRRPAFA